MDKDPRGAAGQVLLEPPMDFKVCALAVIVTTTCKSPFSRKPSSPDFVCKVRQGEKVTVDALKDERLHVCQYDHRDIDGWIHVKARNGQLLVEPLELPLPKRQKEVDASSSTSSRDELYAAVERELRAAKSWRGIIYEVRRLYTLVHKEIADRLIIYHSKDCHLYLTDGAELKTATLDTLEELYHEVQKWYDTSQVSTSYYSEDILSQDTHDLEALTAATGATGYDSGQAVTSSAAPHPPLPPTSYVLTKRQRRRLADGKKRESIVKTMDIPVFFARKYDKWPVPLLMTNLHWYTNLIDYVMNAFWIPNRDFTFEYIDDDGRAMTVNDEHSLKQAIEWNKNQQPGELNFLIVRNDVQVKKQELSEYLRQYLRLCRQQNPATRASMAGASALPERANEVWEIQQTELRDLDRVMKDADSDREKLLDAINELPNRPLIEGLNAMVHFLDSDPNEQLEDLEHFISTIHKATQGRQRQMGLAIDKPRKGNVQANLMKVRVAGTIAGAAVDKKKSKCSVM